MTLFEALTGGAFDRLNWQHSGEFDKIFQKSQMPRGLTGGGMGGFGIDRYIIHKIISILFKISASALFLHVKYSLNVANFNLDIVIKYILI